MASRNIAGGRAWFGKWVQICAALEGCYAGIEVPVDFMNAVVRFEFLSLRFYFNRWKWRIVRTAVAGEFSSLSGRGE